MKKIGIIVPCFNEEENINEIYEKLQEVIISHKEYNWTILFSDNASVDNTVERIRDIAQNDKNVRAVVNQSNYGPYKSIMNGMSHLDDCDAIIEISADLEDPPTLIPLFIREWENGNKVVLAQYTSRQGNPIINFSRRCYYSMLSKLADTKQLRNVTGFGLYDKTVIDAIKKLKEPEPKIRYLVSELGYQITLIPYDKPSRKKGKSTYNIYRYYREAVDSIVGTSKLPLQLASLFGFFVSMLSFLVALFYLVYKLIFWDTFIVGTAPLVIGVFFLGGIQLFFIGVIGEYLSEVLRRITKRPMVIEKEKINIQDDSFDEKDEDVL